MGPQNLAEIAPKFDILKITLQEIKKNIGFVWNF